MTLRLTPDMLAASYEYLRACPPFKTWGLPEADDIAFSVTRHKDRFSHMVGEHRSPNAEIAVSEHKVGCTRVLMESMAHEMIHLHQHRKKLDRGGHHNADFQRRAKRVCSLHGFDSKTF
jgi:hypothetical protein